MMPSFTAPDVGMLGREWWHRCQPQIGLALAIGVLFSLLVGGGLAVKQVSLDTLTLWAKYQFARSAEGIGLSSMKITWPGERGESLTSVEELLKTPGLDAWAEPVSREIGYAASPALISGLLAIVATLLWSITKIVPARDSVDSPAVDTAVIDTPPVALEESLPVIPPQPPPPTVELPHLTSQNESPSPSNPPPAPQHDAPSPVAQPSPPPPHPPPASTPTSPAAAPAGKRNLSYEFYWGFSELPFENVPDPKFYFPTAMHEEALHRLLYGIQTRKGALMLTGEIGCGKTLLSRELSLHLAGQQYDVAVIANPSFGVEDFLTEVLYQLGIEPTKTKVKLLHLLNERLLDNYKRGKQTVVVIDEAQTIPDDQIFEELRLLLNFQLNDRFLLTLVLMGQPELNDRVMKLKQFAQRISIMYHLGYFSGQQTTEYIRFRMKAAKCTKEIFTEEALGIIFNQSGGIPRNINTLCDLCLLIGFMDRAPGVDRKIVERASAERGQLGLF
jgi:general secretion pathway protein A